VHCEDYQLAQIESRELFFLAGFSISGRLFTSKLDPASHDDDKAG